uniref:RNA 3'-terminal phosphate cyclase n=1 Tax=Capra hircus TaxID=9925 RepID=A0A8C2S485_CAPHI
MAGPRVEVDGGIMEGGGQILRVSTALSCLLGLPLRVQKIRAGRIIFKMFPTSSVITRTRKARTSGQGRSEQNILWGQTKIHCFKPGLFLRSHVLVS